MKRILTLFAAIMLSVFQANAQTGTWSGKLDVQGTKLSIVFHLDGDNRRGVAAHPDNPGYNINDESSIIVGKVISCSAKSFRL